jgi:hypothetical protein
VHDAARWYQVDLVCLNGHVFFNHDHRHPCVTGQQGVHHALVVWRQVLNHHKRRTRIAGAGGKEALKRIQSTGGSANAHHMASQTWDVQRW